MKAIKVQFKKVGKRYYFDPAGFKVKIGDYAVVETVRGLELGQVVSEELDIKEDELIAELKPILRIATKKDLEMFAKNQELALNVIDICKTLVRKNNLEMKLLFAEYTLDRTKLIIYFESEQRVDFRQLVKDLAEQFKVRIELRQIGPRDGAKIVGGLGPCGLITCCTTFIEEFDNVSIKMAKNQNLSLNPTNISGICGKLLCCIKYENETYQELRKNLPDTGDFIRYENKEGKVLSVDVLSRILKVKYKDETIEYINANLVEVVKHKKEHDKVDPNLARLEK